MDQKSSPNLVQENKTKKTCRERLGWTNQGRTEREGWSHCEAMPPRSRKDSGLTNWGDRTTSPPLLESPLLKSEIVNVREAATYLKERLKSTRGWVIGSLRRKASQNEIPSLKIDGVWHFHTRVLDQIIEQQNARYEDLEVAADKYRGLTQHEVSARMEQIRGETR